MAEHGLDGRDQVIGFAFDGTGYGTDGAVWGGEVLVADYKGFRRVGAPGLRAAARRRRQRAPAVPDGAGPPARRRASPWDADLPPVAACPPDELRRAGAPAGQRVRHACRRPAWAGCSTRSRRWPACGTSSTTRPQAAIELEGLARGVAAADAGAYAVRRLPDRRRRGRGRRGRRRPGGARRRRRPAPRRAGRGGGRRFHAAVAGLVADLAGAARAATGLATVVLGGGVFANALLLSAARRRLRAPTASPC